VRPWVLPTSDGRCRVEHDVVSAGRILVVDDDPQIRRVMKVTLTGQGYEVDDAKSGEVALEKLGRRRFDVVLLDMNMSGMSGLETCRMIREQSEISIIMLTVRDSDADKVEALDAGADDYVTKPFNPSELSARIRAALRRTPWTHGSGGRLTLGPVEIDFDTRQVTARGRHVRLTPKEFDLLRYLVAHPNKVLTHRELLHSVWGRDRGEDIDALRVVVNQLRKKIEANPSSPTHLLTEPWVGYRLFLPSVEPAALDDSRET
jgi:two-component system KDP operon response regulator KdpE